MIEHNLIIGNKKYKIPRCSYLCYSRTVISLISKVFQPPSYSGRNSFARVVSTYFYIRCMLISNSLSQSEILTVLKTEGSGISLANSLQMSLVRWPASIFSKVGPLSYSSRDSWFIIVYSRLYVSTYTTTLVRFFV